MILAWFIAWTINLPRWVWRTILIIAIGLANAAIILALIWLTGCKPAPTVPPEARLIDAHSARVAMSAAGLPDICHRFTDQNYALINQAWFEDVFVPAWLEELQAFGRYELEANDCDDFSMRACTSARLLHRKAGQWRGWSLAIGIIDFPPNMVQGRPNGRAIYHSANVLLIDDGQGGVEVAVWEPIAAEWRHARRTELSHAIWYGF